MEESEKRRERLRAMRMEANAASDQSDVSTPQQQNTPLSNPLLDNQQPSPTQPPRFDFYTDPLAAFSSHKPPPSQGSRNSETSHYGVHQFQNSYAPHQNIHQGGGPYNNPSSTTSPRGVSSSYHGRQIRGPSYPDHFTGPIGFRSPFPGHQGSPGFNSPQFYGSPGPGSGCGGSPYPVHQGSSNFEPHIQGWGSRPNNSTRPGLRYEGGATPGPGRGRARWDGVASPSSRYSRGRGRDHGFDAQARSHYCQSMVEDPWKFLTPVTWQSDDDGVSFFNSWGSVKITSGAKNNRGSVWRTSGAKKARVSNKSRTEPSLAEFLAAAGDEEDGVDAGSVMY